MFSFIKDVAGFFWEPINTKEKFRDFWNVLLTAFACLATLMVGFLLLSALTESVIKAIGTNLSMIIGIAGIVLVTIYFNWPSGKKTKKK